MLRLFFSLILLLFLSASAPVLAVEELTVSAAISLREPILKIARHFERENQRTHVIFNFGASGGLAQQIEAGAPIDVFVSADEAQMRRLVVRGLMKPASIANLVGNRLVLVHPRAGRPIASLKELSGARRVVIGNPATVPAGRYAREALTKTGLYDVLLRRQALVFADNARQALDYVDSAAVDAGFVYATDLGLVSNVVVGFTVPAGLSGAIVYPVGLVAESKHLQLGQKFVSFLKGPLAQREFLNAGFLPPQP